MAVPLTGVLSSLCLSSEIARLQKIHLLIDEVSSITKTLSSSYEPSLDAFVEPFDRLLFEFADEYAEYALDEVVVGAIAPAVSHPPHSPICLFTLVADSRFFRFLPLLLSSFVVWCRLGLR